MTYPFASLPENLAAFCTMLRRDHHFRIGPRELMDAARALGLSDITREPAVRDALRTTLSKTYDDVRAFDAAFDRFFHGRGSRLAITEAPGARDRAAGESASEPGRRLDARPSDRATTPDERFDGRSRPGSVRDVADREGDATAPRLRASYSPLESEGTPLVLEPPGRPWLQAANALTRRVHAGVSRRWIPATRGSRFDVRRTLRSSLRTGGVPVTPRWHAHPRRRPRFVLLIDGSRSMGASSEPALHTAVALSAVSPGTETFAFSTKLRRVTRDARRAAAGETRTVHVEQAWGGGTTIGACLDAFLHGFGERLLGPDTVLIIASDGLDVGSPELLRQSMERLARRSFAIVWTNPLLATAGYEPTAAGMRLAKPYVDVLTNVDGAEALRALARIVPAR